MIFLTKMDKSGFYLNPLLIEQIQESPDVIITLTNSKKILVRDKKEVILEKIVDFWRAIYNLEHKADYLKKATVDDNYDIIR